MSRQVIEAEKLKDIIPAFAYKDHNFIEVVSRREDGRIGDLIRVTAQNLEKDNNDNQLANAAMNAIRKTNKGLADVRKEMGSLSNGIDKLSSNMKDMASQVDSIFSSVECVKTLSYLNTGLSLANIAVDVAGFAMIAVMLNNLDKKIQVLDFKLDKLVVERRNEKIKEFQKLIMRFNTMKDCITKDNVDMKEMETLIFDLRAFISEMIRNMQESVFEEEIVLNIINTLMPTYTILFCEYLDRYFFENKTTPPNYEMFMNLYDEINNSNFKQKLEDYFFFEEKMHSIDVLDTINAQMLLGINGRVQVEDQLEILKKFETREAIEEFDRKLDEIAYQEAEATIPEMAKIFNVDENKCREALQLGA